MAEIVDALPVAGKCGPRVVSPWNNWLDGRVWKLTRGVDFMGKQTSVRTNAYCYAARLGKKVSVRIVGDDVFVQATKDAARTKPAATERQEPHQQD